MVNLEPGDEKVGQHCLTYGVGTASLNKARKQTNSSDTTLGLFNFSLDWKTSCHKCKSWPHINQHHFSSLHPYKDSSLFCGRKLTYFNEDVSHDSCYITIAWGSHTLDKPKQTRQSHLSSIFEVICQDSIQTLRKSKMLEAVHSNISQMVYG